MEEELAVRAAREVSELIPIMQNKIMRRFSASSATVLTPLQLEALRIIAEDGPMAMHAIASRMHMSKQQLTRFVDSLVRKDCLMRKYMENNRRTIFIEITDRGLFIMEEYQRESLAFHTRDFRSFSEDELSRIHDAAYTLRTLLEKI